MDAAAVRPKDEQDVHQGVEWDESQRAVQRQSQQDIRRETAVAPRLHHVDADGKCLFAHGLAVPQFGHSMGVEFVWGVAQSRAHLR